MAAKGGPRRRGTRTDRYAALFDGHCPPQDRSEERAARTVAALRALPVPTMSPGALAATRAMLLTRAAAGEDVQREVPASEPAGPEPTPVPGTARLAATIVTRPSGAGHREVLRSARPALVGALAASVAAVGVAVSATQAMPGELLYGVKRQVEHIQVSLASSRVDRARIRLAVARTRMDELTATQPQGEASPAAGTNTSGSTPPSGGPPPGGSTGGVLADPALPGQSPSPVPHPEPSDGQGAAATTPPGHDIGIATTLLRDWCADAAAGSTVLIEEVRAGNMDARQTLLEFAADQSTRLDALLGPLGGAAVPEVTTARQIIHEVDAVLAATAPHAVPPAPQPAHPEAEHPETTRPEGTLLNTAAPSAGSGTAPRADTTAVPVVVTPDQAQGLVTDDSAGHRPPAVPFDADDLSGGDPLPHGPIPVLPFAAPSPSAKAAAGGPPDGQTRRVAVSSGPAASPTPGPTTGPRPVADPSANVGDSAPASAAAGNTDVVTAPWVLDLPDLFDAPIEVGPGGGATNEEVTRTPRPSAPSPAPALSTVPHDSPDARVGAPTPATPPTAASVRPTTTPAAPLRAETTTAETTTADMATPTVTAPPVTAAPGEPSPEAQP